MAQLIDGKVISAQIKDEVKEKIAGLKEQGCEVTLVVIQVGADPASSVYVRNKKKACEYVGIRSLAYELPEETTEEKLTRWTAFWCSCRYRNILTKKRYWIPFLL